MITLKCPSCGRENQFEQPYPIHAGFSNEGFLYNDDGNLTLTWSTYDPTYVELIGRHHPWALTPGLQTKLEDLLRPAPSGGRWRFANPARCLECAAPISDPITRTIYYVMYRGSIVTDIKPESRQFSEWLVHQP